MRLLDLPIDRPVATIMVLVSLTVLGGVALRELPLSFMPAVERPVVVVEVPFPGSHPLEALEQVIRPIEEEVAAISEIKSLESTAESGEASIRAEFDWSVNLDLKRLEVKEAVDRVRDQLPESIGHVRVEGRVDGPGGGAVLEGRISAERNLSESWDLLDHRIRRPLERIRGVARVDLGGVEPQQVRIDLDPAALKVHGIEVRTVQEVLQGANVDLDVGVIRGATTRLDVRSLGRLRSIDDIASLRIAGDVRLRDVAAVVAREPVIPYGRHLNREFAISIEVQKEPSANTVETVDRLMARIEEIKRDPELAGITLLVWNNAGEEIRRSLGGLRNAGLFGGLLSAAVLYLFLRRLRTTLIVVVAIPFSLLVTCGAMFLLGKNFNVLTLLGLMLGVGMLVDNAVVVIENIYRLQGQGLGAMEAARAGTAEVALAVLASTATTVIVWSWLFVADRSEMTIYVGEVAITVCLAIACSLVVSLTFIPLAAARFVPGRPITPGFVLRRLVPGYRALLRLTLRHRVATLVALALLAGSAAWPIRHVEKSGEPRIQQRAVGVRYEFHDPVTKERMEDYVDHVEAWLDGRKAELGWESVYSFWHEQGRALTLVYPPYEKTTDRDMAGLRARLKEGLPRIPGVTLEIGERRWWRHGSEGRRMVTVALHGEDPEYLEELARDVEARLRGLEGVKEILGPSVRGRQEARVLIDVERAHRLGVSPRAIAETIGMVYRGRRLSTFQGDRGELDMLLGLPEDAQPGIASLSDQPIPARGGGTVPLGSVAEVALTRIDPEIERIDRQTTTWVNVEFERGVTTDEGQTRVAKRLRSLRTPEGYSWDWGSWGRNRDKGLDTMMRGVLVSLLVVVLLMAALFESITQPLAILISLPLAFFGGFWALWLGGYELDTVAFVGVVILIGVVVNNGIVMVDHVNNLRRGGMERVEALVEGCGDRLRPILMTAITTIFGLIPLAFSRFTVAGAYIDSLGVVVIGGLMTSTVFTLLAMPVWYATLEDVGSVALRALPRRRRSPAPAVAPAR